MNRPLFLLLLQQEDIKDSFDIALGRPRRRFRFSTVELLIKKLRFPPSAERRPHYGERDIRRTVYSFFKNNPPNSKFHVNFVQLILTSKSPWLQAYFMDLMFRREVSFNDLPQTISKFMENGFNFDWYLSLRMPICYMNACDFTASRLCYRHAIESCKSNHVQVVFPDVQTLILLTTHVSASHAHVLYKWIKMVLEPVYDHGVPRSYLAQVCIALMFCGEGINVNTWSLYFPCIFPKLDYYRNDELYVTM